MSNGSKQDDPLTGFDTEVSALLSLQEILECAASAKVRAEAVGQVLGVFTEAFIARVRDWGDERRAGNGAYNEELGKVVYRPFRNERV